MPQSVKPLKHTKDMLYPIISNEALILLWIYQYANGNSFTKYQAVSSSLGINAYQYKIFDIIEAEFTDMFEVCHRAELLRFDNTCNLWFVGPALEKFLMTNFGVMALVHLSGWTPFDAALAYNSSTNTLNVKAQEQYIAGENINPIDTPYMA